MNPIEFETIMKLMIAFALLSAPAPFLLIAAYKKEDKRK